MAAKLKRKPEESAIYRAGLRWTKAAVLWRAVRLDMDEAEQSWTWQGKVAWSNSVPKYKAMEWVEALCARGGLERMGVPE